MPAVTPGAVFLFALACRAAFWLLTDQPLLYTHQYHYFSNALGIAAHPAPLDYVLRSDEWRTWDGHWTIAPLYHLFAGFVFRVFGPHLAALRLLQCVLDAAAAVGVAALGRRVAGPRGAWAGVAYALYWPALEMPTWTLTENLHTFLFVTGVALLGVDPAPGRARSFLAGLVLGLSALARSVSTGFLGLAALWRLAQGTGPWPQRVFSRGAVPAVCLGLGGALMIAPWTARNIFLIGEPVLIESAAFENIWWANHFTERDRYLRQEKVVHEQPTPALKRKAALHFALRGIRQRPGMFVEKVRTNFWHFLRPEGLQNLLRVERSLEPWRHVGTLLLDDLPLVIVVPLFVVFLAAGRPSSARALIALWAFYYLLMVVVIFHNEIRYRSALMPLALAGAAGGLAVLADPERRGGGRTRLALLLGLLLVCGMLQPYVVPGWRALSAWWASRPALAAARTGSPADALRLAAAATQRDPRSPRPWLRVGHALAERGESATALEAYRAAARLANYANWRPQLGLARLLPAAEAAPVVRQLDRMSWDADPWLVLEAAWRELPPPVTDEVLLARNDYGAVRGFLHPRGLDPAVWAHRLEWSRYEDPAAPQPPAGPHRWTRGRAWIRARPTQAAPLYDVTLHMGAPFPSTLQRPEVKIRISGGAAQRVVLGDALADHSFAAPPRPDGVIEVEIQSPIWSRYGEPADQGVRIDRMSVRPRR